MPVQYLYPLYTFILALSMIVVVPREDIKKLAIWGAIFGFLGDI
jgi:drug/metabolite transporter (DMT)-like permease